MAELDPAARTLARGSLPACGSTWTVLLDPAAIVVEEGRPARATGPPRGRPACPRLRLARAGRARAEPGIDAGPTSGWWRRERLSGATRRPPRGTACRPPATRLAVRGRPRRWHGATGRRFRTARRRAARPPSRHRRARRRASTHRPRAEPHHAGQPSNARAAASPGSRSRVERNAAPAVRERRRPPANRGARPAPTERSTTTDRSRAMNPIGLSPPPPFAEPSRPSPPPAPTALATSSRRSPEPGPREPDVVHVHIGRVEVRATVPAPQAPRPARHARRGPRRCRWAIPRRGAADMSNALAIASVSAVLRPPQQRGDRPPAVQRCRRGQGQRAAPGPGALGGDARDQPHQLVHVPGDPEPGLAQRRSAEPRRQRGGPRAPPLALDLHYLVSAYGRASSTRKSSWATPPGSSTRRRCSPGTRSGGRSHRCRLSRPSCRRWTPDPRRSSPTRSSRPASLPKP